MIKTSRYIYILFLLVLISCPQGFAKKYVIDSYSTQDGLSNNYVTSMYKDSDGLMWFGTIDGLSRFDSYSFKSYDSFKHPELKNSKILNIGEDNFGALWITTNDRSIYRFNKYTGTYTPLKLPEEFRFTDRILTADGSMFLWGTNHKLYRVEVNQANGEVLNIHEHTVGNILTKINLATEYNGHILIGTSTGIYELDKNLPTAKLIQGTEKFRISSFYMDGAKQPIMYFGTGNNGIVAYETSTNKFHELENSSGIENISALHILPNNELIIGTLSSGIYIYNLDKKAITLHKNSGNSSVIPSNHIVRIVKEGTKRYWISTDEPGMLLFESDSKEFNFYKLDGVLNPVTTGNIIAIYNNKVIINSYKQGLAVYDPERRRFYPFYEEIGLDSHFFSQPVHRLLIDEQQNIWISPWSKKLYKISSTDNQVDHIMPFNNPKNGMMNQVRSIAEDYDKKSLWIGTREGGLLIYDNKDGRKKEVEYFKTANGKQKSLNSVYTILPCEKETWLGLKGEGLVRVRNRNGIIEAVQMAHKRLQNISVYALSKDDLGRIWIGSFESGLMVLEPKGDDYELYSIIDFAEHPKHYRSIRTMLIDREGIMWVGTTDGLLKFDSKEKNIHAINVSTFNDIASNDIQTLFEDSRGIKWVGAIGGGLCSIKRTNDPTGKYEIQRFGIDDGLPNNSIIALCEDNEGNIWMGTEDNVCHFNYRNSEVYTFTRSDGFPNLTISEQCAYKTSQGLVVFGTAKGFIKFDPRLIYKGSDKFNLIITDFTLFNDDKSPDWSKGEVTLKHNQSFFSIDFAALDFSGGENIQYAYLMENLEENWNFINTKHSVTYTNLMPGEYVFKVMASKNSTFDSNDPVISLKITILPPIWETTFAKIIYALLSVIVIAIILRALSNYYKMRHKNRFEAELYETKMRFFTNISHELRTPLTLISGPIEKLLSQSDINPDQREQLTYVDNNVRKLLGMVNQILDFRKTQSNKMVLHTAPIEIVAYLSNVFENFSLATNDKQIDFTFNSTVPWLRMSADAEKLAAIVENLLSNAIKFTPTGGKIELTIDYIEENNLVNISVKDNGIGIPKTAIPSLFECFTSYNPSTETKSTGIGLYLVKSFVELHGGHIAVESVLNKGSIFTVTLPYYGINEEESELADLQEEENEEEEKDERLRILIVEDNDELRSFVSSLLNKEYKIIEAENGRIALDMITDQEPDMIISDIMMPEMDGIELLKQIREDIKTSHIPLILLSAKNSVSDQIKGFEYGADGYIGKPFSPALLKSKINNIFEIRAKHYERLKEDYGRVNLSSDVVICQKRDEELLQKVIDYIEDSMNRMNDFNIEDIVEFVGLSRTVFYKKIKSLTGVSPVELVRELRIKRAASLILTGEFNISEVSNMVGFSDVRYFSRHFKKKYGVIPSNYGKENQ